MRIGNIIKESGPRAMGIIYRAQYYNPKRAGRIRTWLYHLRVALLGDEDLVLNGKSIPCKKCRYYFKSYAHFGDFSYTYDGWCPDCVAKKKRQNE